MRTVCRLAGWMDDNLGFRDGLSAVSYPENSMSGAVHPQKIDVNKRARPFVAQKR